MNANENSFYEILILYGSQTGTAKFAAEDMQRELYKLNYFSKICEMDSYNFINLPEESYIIFIISTTGYGEFPSNSKNFWAFLMRKDLPLNSLENVNYTLFGLGDSSYEKFNQCAKLLNSRLNKLSANLIHPVALGDDQHDFGYEAEFDPWMQSVIEELFNYFPEKIEFKYKHKNVLDFLEDKINFEVEVIDNQNFNEYRNCVDNDNPNFYYLYEKYKSIINNENVLNNMLDNKIGIINKNEIITSDDSVKKTFNVAIEIEKISNFIGYNKINKNEDTEKLIEIINNDLFYNFADEKIKYFSRNVSPRIRDHEHELNLYKNKNFYLSPGDSILLFPENDNDSVLKFLRILDLHKDDIIIFKLKKECSINDFIFPFFIKAEDFIKKWLNINGYPNRFFCYVASLFTKETLYKEKLELFSSKSSVNIDYFF